MEFIQKISESLLDFSEIFGFFAIPFFVLASIALLAFAKYSYKLLKIVLPVAAGAVTGYICGDLCAPMVERSIRDIPEFISPSVFAGLIIGVIVALLCFKLHNITILIVGAGFGYITVSWLAHKLLRTTDFVNRILWFLEMSEAVLFSTIVSIVCALVAVLVFQKYFKKIYIVSTSMGCAMAALAIPAMLIFANVEMLPLATLIAAGIGAIIGIFFCDRQFVDSVY